MNPLITLSIPVYNVEKYVEKALTSALNQTYDNLEILVIDDKGNDNSMAVVRDVISNHPRGSIVKIIEHEHNQGLGATRNTSIDNALGKYIFFMDSDDSISHDCIELLYKAIEKANADMAIGSYAAVLSDGTISKNYIYDDPVESGYCPMEKWIYSRKIYVQVWNKLYKTGMLRKNNVRCIPSNRNEDVFFTFQLITRVKKIVFIPKVTYFYLIENPSSIMFKTHSSLFDEKSHIQYIGILEQMLNYIEKHNLKRHNVVIEYFKWFYGLRIGYILSNKYISRDSKIKYLNEIKNLKATYKLGYFDKRMSSILLSNMPASFVELVYRFRKRIRIH